jgi:uncharacterized membrane protein (UPF0127 family)
VKELEVRLPDGSLLCSAGLANGILSRGLGLLGRRFLSPEEGLLIEPCSSVHTFFMRFTIDVVFLDLENRVVRIRTLEPFRYAMGASGAKKVLELSAGRCQWAALKIGDQVSLVPS